MSIYQQISMMFSLYICLLVCICICLSVSIYMMKCLQVKYLSIYFIFLSYYLSHNLIAKLSIFLIVCIFNLFFSKGIQQSVIVNVSMLTCLLCQRIQINMSVCQGKMPVCQCIYANMSFCQCKYGNMPVCLHIYVNMSVCISLYV